MWNCPWDLEGFLSLAFFEVFEESESPLEVFVPESFLLDSLSPVESLALSLFLSEALE